MSYFRRPAEFYKRTRWSYPDTLRIRGSVIPAVTTDVFVITTFSAVVMSLEASHIFDFTLNIPSVIVPALSVVVGLILAFRTNTAYDRYWEGRKLWSSLDVQIRNFSRMIWVGMKETQHPAGTETERRILHSHLLFGRSSSSLLKASKNGKSSSSNGSNNSTITYGATHKTDNISTSTLIEVDGSDNTNHRRVQTQEDHDDDYEKVIVIKLLLAYAVAVKHHLRQEFGIRYYDLEGLLPVGYEPCAATDSVEIKMPHDHTLGDSQRHYSHEPWTIETGNDDGQMSLPLEIAHGLSLWVIGENRAGRIEPALVGTLLGSINTMVDIFTNMERIVFTPIPMAYAIHLRQVVYLYCLALPFTFLEALGWLTVPLMCLVSFTLFGMEAIATEIQNPFGKDENDLHMDEFCQDLKRELDYTVNLKNTVPGAHA
ncbi:ion channel-forming bestrophin family protein [Entomortierella parvispora]|uniref:Ion channel-forming bestrophin family protein n=1 Tax=Entomortierella parvispora TaxID=205924 RepID=A0A9P3H160_9FUNG|nr:ion channel-forming bestrophin family protein [Entomortierella parvispora]